MKPIVVQVDKEKLAQSFRDLEKAMRAASTSLLVGSAYRLYRAGDQVRSAEAVGRLTQTERDALHSWARWLIGGEPQ